jgi:hypothetical protein
MKARIPVEDAVEEICQFLFHTDADTVAAIFEYTFASVKEKTAIALVADDGEMYVNYEVDLDAVVDKEEILGEIVEE